MKIRNGLVIALTVAFAFGISACSSSDSTESASGSCEKADLVTVADGVLTIATGEPAY